MESEDTLFGRVRHGVLTLSGDAPSIKVENGMLVVRDGPHVVPADFSGPAPPVETRIETLRLAPGGCPVKSIVVTRPDGFITFAAFEWLRQVGVSLVQLDWHGEVLLAAGSPGPDRPAMRRAQALAAGSEAGLAIMRRILRRKLARDAAVARLLGGEDTAALIDRLAGEMDGANTGIHALALEAAAASAYWSLWADVRMQFARRDRVPDHWCVFGSRRPSRAAPESRSGMSGSNRPRNAPSAPVALLNYLFGLAASQMTIALAEVGLDPGVGIFHADRDGRPSLAYDAIEPLRPYIAAWLLCCLAEVRFAKRDFYEEGDGTIRITRPLTSWLALSAPLWRAAAEVVARWLADSLTGFARLGDRNGFDDGMIEATETGATTLPARAAQRAVDAPVRVTARLRPIPEPLPSLPTPGRAYKPALAHEVMPRACHECGRALVPSKSQPHTAARRKFCSGSCAAVYRAEMRRMVPLEERSDEIAAIRSIEAARSDKLRRHAEGRIAWDGSRAGDETVLRRWYVAEVAPRLGGVARTEIVRAIGVSRVYARDIARGKVPHPRHFGALAALGGVEMPKNVRVDGNYDCCTP
jgi:CRISPR-associated endonuclease Cas1